MRDSQPEVPHLAMICDAQCSATPTLPPTQRTYHPFEHPFPHLPSTFAPDSVWLLWQWHSTVASRIARFAETSSCYVLTGSLACRHIIVLSSGFRVLQ